jgi:integrase
MFEVQNDIRDRALLLLGFLGAFRRSELAALTWEHLDWRENGISLLVRRSKNDPEGAGMVKPRPAR